jgi:3'-5' exoribonuclease
MEWRCAWCGKPHEENDPPCDNCGHGEFEKAVVPMAPDDEADDGETMTQWVCQECGNEHPKHTPPCDRCGGGPLERREITYDESQVVDEMLSEIDGRIEQFDDLDLQALVQHFYADAAFRSAFQEAPAAQQIHHAYRGGLLEHVYEVLLLSDTLVDLYPSLDRDLLTTGILLHDIGKLRELSTGPDPAYTDQGQLLGHIAIGAAAVAKAIDDQPDFPQELAWQVQHLILSHHGRHEWGSPRRPKTLEAIALHHLEHLDGQVNRFDEMLRAARQRGAVLEADEAVLEAGEVGLDSFVRV